MANDGPCFLYKANQALGLVGIVKKNSTGFSNYPDGCAKNSRQKLPLDASELWVGF
jgi:hypothetical protein